MSIGEFARRSRLSLKALRLYDGLGPLPAGRVDEDSGYRFHGPGQLGPARLIASLRQLQVPLAEIKAILPLAPVQAADRIREFWAAIDAEHTAHRADILSTGLGLRITYLPSEVGLETYQDFAVPFSGQSRG